MGTVLQRQAVDRLPWQLSLHRLPVSLSLIHIFGKSEDKRNLYEVVIGNPDAKKHLLVMGNLHAREHMTCLLYTSPHDFYKTEKRVVHVLSDAEIRSFFENVDNYVPKINAISFQRLSIEYKVLFRTIYCCGLRISEARKLKWEDVDLHKGTLRIMQSKGHKDRLVYMTDDLADVCLLYTSRCV